MTRILCWLGVHRAAPGVHPKGCIWFYCTRCCQVLPGGYGRRKGMR